MERRHWRAPSPVGEHKEAITAVAFSTDGKLLASSSEDGVTRLTKVADGKAVTNFVGPNNGAATLAFAPDGKVLFAGGKSPEVLAWEVAGGKEIVRLKTGDDGSVMAFSGGGGLALTANGEIRAENTLERLRLWSPFKKLPVAAIPLSDYDHRSGILCKAAICSQDSRMIAASQVSEFLGLRRSYGAALLRLWERASGQQILTLGPTATKVLAFSPNGRLVAAGGTGQSDYLGVIYSSGIDIWDAVTGKKMTAWRCHQSASPSAPKEPTWQRAAGPNGADLASTAPPTPEASKGALPPAA